MKFIHTSDWHLGRQFHNVSLLEDQKQVLNQITRYVTENHIDALIIAGDIYDRSVPPTAAIEVLDGFLNHIVQDLNVPVIMISGNHDGAKRLGFGSKQFDKAGLHIISSLEQLCTPVEIVSAQDSVVHFYGMPYSDPETVRHHYDIQINNHDDAHAYLASQIGNVLYKDVHNVVISHCFIDGAETCESERTLSIGGADRVSYEHFKSFDYVALGHLHQAQKRGLETIRYSGSIMKYSFSEQHHRKSVTLVEICDESGEITTRALPLNAPHDMRVLEGELENLLELGRSDANFDDYLLVRLTDKHAILDPMAKLREVYPNVLHLEKPGMLVGVDKEISQARLGRSEVDMFRDFFLEVQGDEMTDNQKDMLSEVVMSLKKQSEE
ncbi:exonuclease SbcCD subunit D [Vibrio sp. McD22-P3]|uniref:exonuclease SbcCD subunit D n=1 Tax=Vibrio sp. McD22-P3 TaxID=2724880 RepID=UPI001F46A62D|nr:exonuclease SbcCD subunit D [Vibrio sp. McD22-P3]MCF4175870.1 exonuclease SbcCD subunit D [Vibrio sp. McD22-P3]